MGPSGFWSGQGGGRTVTFRRRQDHLIAPQPGGQAMPPESLTVAPGPDARSVRTADGKVLRPPEDWDLLPPGDAGLTRRVKAAGPTWTVQERKGRKVFSRGVWAPRAVIAAARAALD